MFGKFLSNMGGWTLWAVLVAVVTFIMVRGRAPAVEQPIRFNHKPHADFGCEHCHQGVQTRARAGIPQIALCLDCHDESPLKDPAQQAAWKKAVAEQHVAWIQLTRVPAHTYFSHARHVGLGKMECSVCHGDMASRTEPPPRAMKPVLMQVCMDCHQQKNVSNDCARCHR